MVSYFEATVFQSGIQLPKVSGRDSGERGVFFHGFGSLEEGLRRKDLEAI